MQRPFKHRRPVFSQPSQYKPARRGFLRNLGAMSWMAIRRTCTALGAMILISAFFSTLTLLSLGADPAPPLPGKMVLFLPFDSDPVETNADASFADAFGGGEPTVREIIGALDRAAEDERVQGLYARINGAAFSLAHVQELRAAVKRFRASGKFAYIYATSYGEAGNGLGGYYLASAFEEIWMQAMGVVSITGLNAQVPFARGALDKVGISPNFFQRKEYKSAYESLTNTSMSAESREETAQLVDDFRAEIMRDIPEDRGMSALKFRQVVDKGLLTSDESVAEGLVTQASYADILVDRMIEAVTGDPDSEDEVFVDIARYIADVAGHEAGHGPLAPRKPKVALVYAAGPIVQSDEGGSGAVAAADEIAPAIMDAAEDEEIAAIVMRVDSPGGSPTASESILRAVERAKEKGKPVIVSMGSAAASGGYWISAYADRIFALPTTVTGSIGVVGGKVAMGALWEKIGLNWESVTWGRNAQMWSVNQPFSAAEAERINAMLDQVYDGFVARVAKGRKMSPEAVEKIAKGRVWSGAQAVKIGLADEAGGLHEALSHAATLAGAQDKRGIEIVLMPAPKTPFERILEMIEGGPGFLGVLERGIGILESLDVLAPLAEEAAARRAGPASVYEPLRVE